MVVDAIAAPEQPGVHVGAPDASRWDCRETYVRVMDGSPHFPDPAGPMHHHLHAMARHPIIGAVAVASDRCSRGKTADRSGPRAVEMLPAAGLQVDDAAVVPDGEDSVEAALRSAMLRGRA